MFYGSNFDTSEFAAVDFRGQNRLVEDPCAVQLRDCQNDKKMKYITTNHRDLIDAKENYNFFSLGIQDQLFVPGEKADIHSDLLLGVNGNTMSRYRSRQNYGQLPLPTMPARFQLHHGNVDTEDRMRWEPTYNRKSCNPKDTAYNERHFAIFNDALDIEIPQAVRSVERPEAGFKSQYGMDSRWTGQ